VAPHHDLSRPANGTIQVETYSPSLGQFIYTTRTTIAGTAQNQFTLTYDMVGGTPFAVIGTDVEPSGGRACVSWPGRLPGKQYEWYVTLSDGTDTTTGPTNRFTTPSTCSQNSDCQDGNVCNGHETLRPANSCQAGTRLELRRLERPCTTDTCDPGRGVSSTPSSPATTTASAPPTAARPGDGTATSSR
jgi:hypothetical protein